MGVVEWQWERKRNDRHHLNCHCGFDRKGRWIVEGNVLVTIRVDVTHFAADLANGLGVGL